MKIHNEDHANDSRPQLEKLSALLDKYLHDRCTDEEQRAIEAWYETLSGGRETNVSEELAAKQRIWNKIHPSEEVANQPSVHRKLHQPQWLAWAASIMLLSVAGLSAYFYMQRVPEGERAGSSATDWTVVSNSTARELSFRLPDSSRITLKPRATLRYTSDFNHRERLVKFEGEAFFEIEKDVTRPFKVVTGDITTRVLGTSFNVKASDEQSVIEVDVRTGKVSVYDHTHSDSGNAEGIILTPNEKVTYYKDEDKWVAELVKDPLPVVTEGDQVSTLVFRDESMRSVLGRIASIYGIEIIVVNDAIYECPFTGDVSQMELHDMLKLICKSIRAEYEVKGTRILIDGAGC